MSINVKRILFGEKQAKKPPALVAVTPHRTGERTLLGVENLLQSVAVPEPFSLELAGDMDGVTLLARCQDDRVVKQQLAAHYPQARVREVAPEDDPMRRRQGELAWGLTLRVDGPQYVPLRTFRDDDLLDAGSDPLIALLGALGDLRPGERLVSRLLLRSLGPDWSQAHQQKAFKNPGQQRPDPSYTYQTKPLQLDGVTMAVLGAGALAALKGYLWVQDGEFLKASLLGAGSVLGLTVAGWGWWRWKQARSRVYDPLLIREKVGRVAFDAEVQVIAFCPPAPDPSAPGRSWAGWRRPTATTTTRPGRASRWGRPCPPFPTRRRCSPRGRDCSDGAASWECARRRPCGTRPERRTRPPWWSGPAHGPSSPWPGASGAERWWDTPRRAGPGRYASPRTCCAATTSTWPAPAWASPP